MQPPRPLISSPPDLLEALAFSAVIFLYIWRWQTAGVYTWLVFPIWLVVSFALHRDTPSTLGWRADNLKAAARIAVPVFLMFITGIVLAGIALGGLHRLPVAHLLEPRRFVGYFAFCVLQQVGLQSLTMNRLLRGISSPYVAAVAGGLLFAALHWPNPVLIPLTFIGGAAMCWLFSRERNILPLVVGQAILGTLVFWAFPIAWHHAMRVGPGYYSFHP
jgi:CAAX prenyl protease-like protein